MATRRRSLQPLPDERRRHHIVQPSSSRYRHVVPLGSKSQAFDLSDIYFNEESRKTHIKNIIDSYFDTKSREHLQRTAQLPEPILPLNLRRRSSLVHRAAKEDSLANTCPQPFNGLNRSEMVDMNNTFLSDQSLPPIFEAGEDPECGTVSGTYHMALSSLVEEGRTEDRSANCTLSTSQSVLIKRRPRTTTQNELYRLMQVYQTKSKYPTFIVKEYKQECTQICIREQKAWAILANSDIPKMWIQTGLMSCQARPFRTLKAHLFEISRQSIKAQTVYKINLRQHYDELFGNANEVLKRMLVSLCKQLSLVRGKLINNKISLGNIVLSNDEAVVVEWGHSAIMETAKVGGETVSCQTTPILKGQAEWFVTPEYLPPEFLENIAGTIDYDVWRLPSAIDMWSVGCMLLELFTLVPLWSPHRCQITNRTNLTRRGLFHSKTRELSEIASKQRKFCSNTKLHLDRLGDRDKRACPTLTQLMIRMLSVEPERRPTPEEVLAQLS